MNLTRVTLGIMFTSETQDAKQKALASNLWLEISGNPQNSTDYYYCCSRLPNKSHGKASLLKTIAEGTTYTGHRIWRNQVGTDQEASYLKHSNRVLCRLPGGKAINSLT